MAEPTPLNPVAQACHVQVPEQTSAFSDPPAHAASSVPSTPSTVSATPILDSATVSPQANVTAPAMATATTSAPAHAQVQSAATIQTTDGGRAYAPKLGTRIQVLWRLSFDEGASQIDQWWGAVVQDCTAVVVGPSTSSVHAARRIFVLLYDPLHGFSEETSRVAFLPNQQLLDIAQLDGPHAGVLDWRIEGESDPDEEEEQSVHSMTALADEVDHVVREAGIEADADLRALAQMPHAQQVYLATGYRSFADALKARLGVLVGSKPDGYVVTKDDINTIMAELRQSGAVTSPTTTLPGPV